MKKYKKYLRSHWYEAAFAGILLLATLLRFINYPERWGLAYDQAHDAMIARYALETFNLPLLGPFSSAGPFQTGGEWYWIIMIGTALFPWALISPWVFLTSLYVLFVAGIMFVGKELINKQFSLIAGSLAAVSTAQVLQGTNLTNQGPQAIVALAAIWFSLRYIKERKNIYLLFLGLTIGLASSIHLQGVLVGTLVIALLLLRYFPGIKGFLLLGLGIFIPWIPVLIVDIQNDFFTVKNMLQYYLHDQYNISLDVLGRRWLTYGGVFLPTSWGHVIGGHTILGYTAMGSLLVVATIQMLQKKVDKKFFLLLVSMLIAFISLRYTRTPLFDSYLVFLHPFILLLTAWVVSFVLTKNKYIGATFLVILLIGSLTKDVVAIAKADNDTAHLSREMRDTLYKRFPNEKFAVYSYNGLFNEKNAPLSLVLAVDGRADDSGRRISIMRQADVVKFSYTIVSKHRDGFEIVDLSASSSAMLKKAHWISLTPKSMYLSTEEWFKEKR